MIVPLLSLSRLNGTLNSGLRASTTRWSSSRSSTKFSDADMSAARKWLAGLNPDTVPMKLCEIAFSRSSGPGGQKVNKTSSKATLRISASSLLSLLPEVLHAPVLASRYHAHVSNDFVIQSDEDRKQAVNANTCHQKLIEMIREAAHETVPGETSAAQSERVRSLQRAEAASRRRMKEHQSKKKSARRGNQGDG